MGRIERDSLGEVVVADDAPWGAQTQRALANTVDGPRLPDPVWKALLTIKGCAAEVNRDLGLLDEGLAEKIIASVGELILEGWNSDYFPLSAYMTGSGTSANMNVNEVVSNIANAKLGAEWGTKSPVHPNDHVNLGQSSNDVFPTSLHLAATLEVRGSLLPALKLLETELSKKSEEFGRVIKLGRTHLMDALPVTVGNEFSAYATQLRKGFERVKAAAAELYELPLGGSAVGTGVNAHPEFGDRVIGLLAGRTKVAFVPATNRFEGMGARDGMVSLSGALRTVAVSTTKIANDIRWMASGPHGGLAELALPAVQPGSSIMPGKVNPVVPEAVIQAAAQVIGNDCTVSQGGLGGVLELNLMMPLMGKNLLDSIHLLAGAAKLLAERCVAGITVDEEKCREYLDKSLALVTPLAKRIGYDEAAHIAKTAFEEKRTLMEVSLERSGLDRNELEELLDPRMMLG